MKLVSYFQINIKDHDKQVKRRTTSCFMFLDGSQALFLALEITFINVIGLIFILNQINAH